VLIEYLKSRSKTLITASSSVSLISLMILGYEKKRKNTPCDLIDPGIEPIVRRKRKPFGQLTGEF